LIAAALLWGGGAFGQNAGNEAYTLGQGLQLGPVRVGGYATLTYQHTRGSPPGAARTALENASLSLWWDIASRWKVFAEFDYESPIGPRASGIDPEQRYLALERMYVDYAIDERTTVRAGKFLTPIGRWNVIHASPLVWTTSRPLVTTLAFPTNVTGAMLSKRTEWSGTPAEWSLYGSVGREFDPDPSIDPFREAIGAHMSISPLPELSLGMSYVNFEQSRTSTARRQLAGIDVRWERRGYELSSEALGRLTQKGESREEGGVFVQAVVPLVPRLFAVARYEYYHQGDVNSVAHLWLGGVAYRVTPAVVAKMEYVGGRRNLVRAPLGFLASLSVLF
jgi:hypothetical protein